MHEAGDPYRFEALETARLLRERLGLEEENLLVCFQSVFGRAEWIGPATIDTVEKLKEGGPSGRYLPRIYGRLPRDS